MTATRNLVPDELRSSHVAGLFGAHFPLALEPAVYTFASMLSRNYQGGYWHFYALGNGGFYMAPDAGTMFHVASDNGFEGVMTADALGITACLYAYSHLSFSDIEGLAEACARHYHLLREHMMDHPEARAILRAID